MQNMSRGKELVKNTGILLAAKISTQLINFLLIPLYTSLLSTQEYGEIDIYTSLVMIVIPFLTLQLEMGVFRFFIEEVQEDIRTTIITTAFITIFTTMIITTVIYCVAAVIFPLKYKKLVYAYYLVVSIATVLQQVCRAYGNNFSYGLASFLSSSLTVAFNVLFIYGIGLKVEGVLISTVIANIISSVYMLFSTHVYKYLDLSGYSKEYRKKLISYSVPLVFNQISSWTINYSDRIIILSVWGTSVNGIYSLANKFSNITNTFFGVYNIAWSENVIRSMKDSDSKVYVNSIFSMTYNLYFALVTGIVNLLPFFFSMMVNENYLEAYGHIPILLLAMFFSGMAATVGSVYIAFGKTREVSITTILAGVCNIIIHLTLLYKWKLYAASLSTLIAFALLFVYRYIFVRKFFKLDFKLILIIPQIIIYAFSWFAYLMENNVLALAGLLMNLLYCVKLFMQYKIYLTKLIKK